MPVLSAERRHQPVFISYRRQDGGSAARRLHQQLNGWFGEGSTFLDTEAIVPGAVFPRRLESAIRSARAVLVVLGPRWVELLKQRGQLTGEPDYVRIEVELALALHAEGRLACLVPVLVDGAQVSMLSEARLPAVQWPGLASLKTFNALPWRHDLPGAAQDWALLRRVVGRAARLKPVPDEAPQQLRTRVADGVKDLLARPALQPLQHAWGADPVPRSGVAGAQEMLAGFGKAVIRCRPALRADAPGTAAVREACRAIVSQLYQLAVDTAAAREWGEAVPSDQPVPAASAATVAMVWAAVQRTELMIAGHAGHDGFVAERTADLGYVDAGLGDDRRAQAHTELWRLLYPHRHYPAPQSAPLAQADLSAMKRFLAAQQALAQSCILSAVVGPSSRAAADFNRLGAELNVAALARTGQGGEVLHVDEANLNTLVYAILLEIEKIQ